MQTCIIFLIIALFLHRGGRDKQPQYGELLEMLGGISRKKMLCRSSLEAIT